MANEITESAGLQASKNGAMVSRSYSAQLSMTGTHMTQDVQTIATTATALTFGGISGAPSKVMIKNLDAVNYVEIAADSGITQFVQKLMPGDFILLSPESGTIYGKAHTASVDIEKTAIEA